MYSNNKRSIATVLLFSFITCGIYFIYWIYAVTSELSAYNEDMETSPTMVVILSLVTCGIYQIYWWYKIGSMFVDAQHKAGVKYVADNKILFLVLALFGFGLVSACILQSDLNRFWDNLDNGSFGQNTADYI